MFVFYKLLKSFADLPGSYYVFKYLIYYIFPLSFKRMGGLLWKTLSLFRENIHFTYVLWRVIVYIAFKWLLNEEERIKIGAHIQDMKRSLCPFFFSILIEWLILLFYFCLPFFSFVILGEYIFNLWLTSKQVMFLLTFWINYLEGWKGQYNYSFDCENYSIFASLVLN